MHVKIGTRGSRLALWQADHVRELLSKGGITSENVVIETKGDKILDRSLAAVGGKGLFTEELEEKLRSGEIDIAVHSTKDVQSSLDEDLEILAFTEREIVNDVLLSFDPHKNLDASESFVIGTSSVRRVAFLKHYYPQHRIVNMRGNLQTRLQKMEDGQCDALLLAYAGVHRMEYDSMISQRIPENHFIPAVGQGTIAVECAVALDAQRKATIKKLVNHPQTEICLLAEREFLRTMQGGCSVPAFALATLESDHILIRGGVISLDGSQIITESRTSEINPNTSRNTGRALAESILAKGGAEILAKIKSERGQ